MEIDLILKGIKTGQIDEFHAGFLFVEIDLILKGIKTSGNFSTNLLHILVVEIDLILKGIKTNTRVVFAVIPCSGGNRPDSQRD